MFAPIFVSLLYISLLCFPGFAIEKLHVSTDLQAQSINNTADEFVDQRLQMVQQQLRERGIQDKAVLKAMSKVSRHRFVAASQAHLAYGDYPLPLSHDQTISQPYVVALIAHHFSSNPQI